ncbi:MAG: tRNA (5-methylaminomethyl-2-thiouridine)(34)-methyltransferase MnmD [Limnohabitans sp.]|nr:tRNA (5-methylaminomethyl-2-thiouridine)(34)-methyltransferase MnmD [Limnohabitans sp.]
MERKIITTLDGSTTIQLVELNECYHSKMGAIQEAYHVFIRNGLDKFDDKPLAILEIGLGTGLNAFITYLESQRKKQNIHYTGIEAYPVSLEEARIMNYCEQLNAQDEESVFDAIHTLPWNQENNLAENFIFKKRQQFFNEITDVDSFDLIYFDAFGFQVQPELWSIEIFEKMFKSLKEKGVLVTYAARGIIKRNMQSVGFKVEKVPGPPGKREMMIGYKN